MPIIRILTEPELRQIIPLDVDAVECTERAFRAGEMGPASTPRYGGRDIAARSTNG